MGEYIDGEYIPQAFLDTTPEYEYAKGRREALELQAKYPDYAQACAAGLESDRQARDLMSRFSGNERQIAHIDGFLSVWQ